MQVVLLNQMCLPRYARDGDVALDFVASKDVEWEFHSGVRTALIPLGVKVKVPRGHGLFLFSRSGMGFNKHITLINSVGVIDHSYRDELMVKLVWQGIGLTEPVPIKMGDRVCQGCCIETPHVAVDIVDDIGDGKAGFGSSDAI